MTRVATQHESICANRRPSLTGLTPHSRVFGLDRGEAIDRYYIAKFLDKHRADIHGRVLEVGDSTYTRQFGTGVTQSDVLHATPENRNATIVGDLATGRDIPTTAFNCMILTQTLGCIYDVRAAIRTIHRGLKTEGVALVTLSGISQISRYDMDRWGDYWRFTSLSARKLCEEVFGSEDITVAAYGNVFASAALLYGLPVEELNRYELDHFDHDYEMLVTVRALKRPQ